MKTQVMASGYKELNRLFTATGRNLGGLFLTLLSGAGVFSLLANSRIMSGKGSQVIWTISKSNFYIWTGIVVLFLLTVFIHIMFPILRSGLLYKLLDAILTTLAIGIAGLGALAVLLTLFDSSATLSVHISAPLFDSSVGGILIGESVYFFAVNQAVRSTRKVVPRGEEKLAPVAKKLQKLLTILLCK